MVTITNYLLLFPRRKISFWPFQDKSHVALARRRGENSSHEGTESQFQAENYVNDLKN